MDASKKKEKGRSFEVEKSTRGKTRRGAMLENVKSEKSKETASGVVKKRRRKMQRRELRERDCETSEGRKKDEMGE